MEKSTKTRAWRFVSELLCVFALCLLLLIAWIIYQIVDAQIHGDNGRLVAPLTAPLPEINTDNENPYGEDMESNDEYNDNSVGELEAFIFEV